MHKQGVAHGTRNDSRQVFRHPSRCKKRLPRTRILLTCEFYPCTCPWACPFVQEGTRRSQNAADHARQRAKRACNEVACAASLSCAVYLPWWVTWLCGAPGCDSLRCAPPCAVRLPVRFPCPGRSPGCAVRLAATPSAVRQPARCISLRGAPACAVRQPARCACLCGTPALAVA